MNEYLAFGAFCFALGVAFTAVGLLSDRNGVKR